MILRELLWDYDFTLCKELAAYENCIQTKKLADKFNEVIDNFIKACNSKTWEPISLLKTYKSNFDLLEKTFKDIILKNNKSKSGMFVWSCDGMELDLYIKDKYNFVISKANSKLDYSKDKLFELTKYEISMLYRKYNMLYDFLIRYAIIKILINRFKFIQQDAEIFGTGNEYIHYNINDVDDILTRILNTEITEFLLFTPDVVDRIVKAKRNRKKSVIDKKPSKAEILSLIDDSMKLTEKKRVIANYFGVSLPTALRWFREYDLLIESYAEKHHRMMLEGQTNIVLDIKETKDEIILRLQKVNQEQSKKIDELNTKIDRLEAKIDILLKQNEDLRQKLFYAIPDKNEYVKEVMDSSRGFNFNGLNDLTF